MLFISTLISNVLSRGFLLLLVVAVLLRALIPSGFMPNADQKSNGIALSMCVVGLSEPTIIYLELGESSSSDQHVEHPALDCAFGSALKLLSLHASSPTLAWGLVVVVFLLLLRLPLDVKRSVYLGAPLGARGPPYAEVKSS